MGCCEREELGPIAAFSESLVRHGGAEFAGYQHVITERPAGDKGHSYPRVQGQHPTRFGASQGVPTNSDMAVVDILSGEKIIDAPHRVEYQFAHDHPTCCVRPIDDGFGVVVPRAHRSLDVSLLFPDRIQGEAGYTQLRVQLGHIDILPRALACPVAKG